jgi:hypothetical protein
MRLTIAAIVIVLCGSLALSAESVDSRIDYSDFDFIAPEPVLEWENKVVQIFDAAHEWLGHEGQSSEDMAMQALDDRLEWYGYDTSKIVLDAEGLAVEMAITANEAAIFADNAYFIYVEAWKDAKAATRHAEAVNTPEARETANTATAMVSRAYVVYSDVYKIAVATADEAVKADEAVNLSEVEK